MSATCRFDGDARQAIRAVFRGRHLGHHRLREPVHLLDHHEDGERHNQEVNHRIDKQAVLDCDGRNIVVRFPEREGKAGKVDVAHQYADGGHHDVRDQGRNDFPESRTNDDADRHIHDIALDGKVFKLFQNSHVKFSF